MTHFAPASTITNTLGQIGLVYHCGLRCSDANDTGLPRDSEGAGLAQERPSSRARALRHSRHTGIASSSRPRDRQTFLHLLLHALWHVGLSQALSFGRANQAESNLRCQRYRTFPRDPEGPRLTQARAFLWAALLRPCPGHLRRDQHPCSPGLCLRYRLHVCLSFNSRLRLV